MASDPSGLPAPQALLDDEELCIEWHRVGPAPAAQLVITFDPLTYLWPRRPFGLDFLLQAGVDVLSVRKKREHFYQTLSRERFDELVVPSAKRYAQVWTYGSSLGAYAALYFALPHPWHAVALSPRSSVHPRFGDPFWQAQQPFLHERLQGPGRCQCLIALDPHDAIDRRYLHEELLNAVPQARVFEVRRAGHPVTQMLSEIGFLAPWLRALLAGRSEPLLDRRKVRSRSSAYLRNLAETCLAHSHPAWSVALAERALALMPKDLLSMRALAEGQLKQRRWPEAEAAIRAALALHPDDPATTALIKRLPKPTEPEPSPASIESASLPFDAPTEANEWSRLRAWLPNWRSKR